MKRSGGAPQKGAAAKRAKAKKAKAASQASFYLKVHVSRFSTVVAVCDKSVIGRRFESAGLVLQTHRRFYEGELVGEAEAAAALFGASNANVVGDKSVELACTALGISKAGVKRIGGTPHLQVYRL